MVIGYGLYRRELLRLSVTWLLLFGLTPEIPVEFDEREDLQGNDQNSPDGRDSCPTRVVELDEYGTSRDDTTHGRHAASLQQQSDACQTRPTSQDADHQLTSAQLLTVELAPRAAASEVV